MKKILLAEDDIDLGTMLKHYLEGNGYLVDWAQDGNQTLDAFTTKNYDLCILDVMMPKLDGFNVAKKMVYINPEIPFLFVTARITGEDKIKGLKLGADDYITKPFNAEELLLRIKNIIKRTEQQQFVLKDIEDKNIIQIGSYAFDFKNSLLKSKDESFNLTKKEAQLIYLLYSQQNQLIRREDILTKIWNSNDFFSGRSMDVYISKIRKYFKDDESIQIKSIRGLGLEFQINNI